MIPGETLVEAGELILNQGRTTLDLAVTNTGDRPVQVGVPLSLCRNQFRLEFDRSLSRGFRLNIPAGTAVRFEPGQTRTVSLVEFGCKRTIYGFNQAVMGPLEDKS